MDDAKMYEQGYNRVYDALELEKNTDESDAIFTEVLDVRAGRSCRPQLTAALLRAERGRRSRSITTTVTRTSQSTSGVQRLGAARFGVQRPPAQGRRSRSAVVHRHGGLHRASGARTSRDSRSAEFRAAQQVGPYLDILRFRVNPMKQRRFHAVGSALSPIAGGLGLHLHRGRLLGQVRPEAKAGLRGVHADATIAWPIAVHCQPVREAGAVTAARCVTPPPNVRCRRMRHRRARRSIGRSTIGSSICSPSATAWSPDRGAQAPERRGVHDLARSSKCSPTGSTRRGVGSTAFARRVVYRLILLEAATSRRASRPRFLHIETQRWPWWAGSAGWDACSLSSSGSGSRGPCGGRGHGARRGQQPRGPTSW